MSAPRQYSTRIRRDESGTESWSSHAEHYRPDGSLAREMVANRDGSHIVSDYAPPDGGENWDTRHAVEGPDGSILVVENAGATQTLMDGQGQVLGQSVWGANGPESVARVEQVYLPALPHIARQIPATLELLGTLYTWMASRELTDGTQPLIAYNSREYAKDNPELPEIIFVGPASGDDLGTICRRISDVHREANTAASNVKIGNYRRMSEYGTAVHE